MLNEAILKIVLNDKTFSQREAEKIVGSRNRLFELVGNGSIRAEKKPSDRQNGRWYCIIPRSTIEKRYDKAREDFNDQYDNSPYKLKCKEFYLGGGVENYEVANKILSMNEEEIAKSYLEDCDPKDWQSMRRYREDLMCDATDIYKTAIDMVKADIHKLTIREKVESFLDDHIKENINDRYFGEDINHEIGLNGKNVDVHIHYYACDYRERDNGDYLTPSSGSGYIDTEYTVTVFDECGNEEFEFNGNFQI